MNPVCFLFFCFLAPMPPAQAVPDGQGGFVPFTNARVMPDGSLRPYDPAIDGVMGPDGRVYYPQPPEPYPPVPPPYPPQPYQPGHVTVGPPRVTPAPPPPAPRHAGTCYGPDGRPIDPPPPDCRTQGAPPP